jgi:hypothetical protein
MASYPSAPDVKLYYNEDGTSVYVRNKTGGIAATIPQGNVHLLCSEIKDNNWGISPGSQQVGFLFPELMEIRGLFYSNNGNSGLTTVQYSADSVDGDTGTWNTWTTTFQAYEYNVPNWRTLLTTIAPGVLSGVRALRIDHPSSAYGSVGNVHIYGHRTNTAGYQGLVLERTDGTALSGTDVDWGDVGRGASGTLAFRVRNTHTQTANSVTASLTALTDASTSLASQTAISTDGGTVWAPAPVSLGTLAPSATKSFQVRFSPGSSASLSIWRQRLKVAASSWS